MNKTSISYADLTWNPLLGCSRASDGCRNCYAERLASTRLAHLPAYKGLTTDGRWNGTIRLLPERLDEPLRRRKPAVIFVGDMGDLFHPGVPFEFVAAVFGVMAACPQHTFLTLTKRPERMVEFCEWLKTAPTRLDDTPVAGRNSGVGLPLEDKCQAIAKSRFVSFGRTWAKWGVGWPLPNWWPGTTVENQREADRRIPLLLKTTAAHRWLSCEPLLEAIDLQLDCNGYESNGPAGWVEEEGIDQVIVGGESGPGARPCDVEWIRSLRDQCRDAGTKFYVKQLGSSAVEPCSSCNGGKDRFDDGGPFGPCCTDCQNTNYEHFRGRDSHGADPAEWPADLRVRELGWGA